MEKVLIGTPIYDGSRRFLEKYLDGVKKQNADLILIDNSKDDDFYNFLKSKGLNVIKIENKGNKFENVFESRKKIVEEFLNGGYEYLFWVDSDVVLDENALNKLISCNKDIVSGVYFSTFNYNGIKAILPVAYKFGPEEELRYPLQIPEMKKDDLMEVHSVGFGCCLIKRNVVENIKLRIIENTESTEDVIFCIDARKKNYKTYLDTCVLCRHGIIMKEKLVWLDPKRVFG